jgi:hypothetical protein
MGAADGLGTLRVSTKEPAAVLVVVERGVVAVLSR